MKAKQDYTMNLGILGSYTIGLHGKATGYSEVYFKNQENHEKVDEKGYKK